MSTISYPDSFRRKIERTTAYALERVQTANTVLDDDTREFALNVLPYALELPEIWPRTRHLLMELAPKMEMAGWRDEWIPYLEAGIARGTAQGDLETVGELHHQLGFIYQFISQYERAEEQFTSSAEAFAQLGDAAREGRGLIRKASAMRSTHRSTGEIEHLVHHAFSLVGDDNYLRGYGYLVLGSLALHNNQQFEQARHYYQKCLDLWRTTNDARAIGWAWNNLAMALLRSSKYTESIHACLQAINYLEQVNDIAHLGTIYNTIGNAYLMLKKFEDALTWYLKSEPIFRATQNFLQLAIVYNNYGMAYYGMKDWKKSEEVLLESIHRFEMLNVPKEYADAFDNLGMTYNAMKQHARAIIMFRHAMCEVYKLRGNGVYPDYRKMVLDHLKETRAEMRTPRQSL